MYLFRSLCVTFFLSLPLVSGFSQSDSTRVYRLILTDGSDMKGHILTEDSLSISFRTIGGVAMTVPRGAIRTMQSIAGEVKGDRFFQTDPNLTRLFFAPTARTLPAGSGYFSIYEIFFPMMAVGATDWLTLAGGVSLFPGAPSQVLYIAPKARVVHTEHLDIALGVLYLKIPEVTKGAGISYAVLTTGSSRAAFTFGLGWGFIGNDFGDAPSIVLGGETQISESVKLLSENWIPAGADGAILSFGIRFFGEHLAGDFGLITSTQASGGFPFFPWVGFVYNF